MKKRGDRDLSMKKLLAIQEKIDNNNRTMIESVLEIERKVKEECNPLYRKRNEITKAIPYFWEIVFKSHPVLARFLKYDDVKIFKHLTLVEVEDLSAPDLGYSITFYFESNPYFEETKLTKTYKFCDGKTEITGMPIKWNDGMVPVVEEVEINTWSPSRESFFSWFSRAQSDLEDVIGDNIKEDLWPNLLTYFKTGPDYDDDCGEVTTNGKENNQNDDGLLNSLEAVLSIQDDIDKINDMRLIEVFEIERKHNVMSKQLFDERKEVIQSIPDFWQIAFLSHPVLTTFIKDDDVKIFKHFTFLEVEGFEDGNPGYSITFNFEQNPYFEGTKLRKAVKFLNEETTEITATRIKWKTDKVPKIANETGRNMRSMSDMSFFAWFSLVDPGEMLENLEDVIADSIKEDLWPNPLTYFQTKIRGYKAYDKELNGDIGVDLMDTSPACWRESQEKT